MMTKATKLFPIVMSCAAMALLSACGGGGGGSGYPGGSGSVTTYQVSATAGTGGTISPASATVDAGGTTMLTVTANSGYAVNGVTGCGGTLSGNTYTTGTINAACTVTATFVAQYVVTATAGAGGTISPASATVNAGGTTTLTVTANSGYIVNGVTGCGGTLSGNTYTTGTINAACTVTANFLAQYTVTATAGAGGTISPASATVNAGGRTTLTVAANIGYIVNGVTGCGGTLSGNTYTTGTINAACTVTANFLAQQYTVTSTAGAGGTISPTSATVNAGGTTMLTVTPKSGYAVSSITGCGGSLAGTTYTTGAINAACTVTASFAAAFTWVGGSNTTDAIGVYGVQGVAAATNNPGARDGALTWTDASGNLWMFGGFTGYTGALNTTVGNFLDDLWKYSPSSGQWTWVGGPHTTCSQGVYGTQGVAAATNVPGARSAPMHWTDASGNVWTFGGGGCDSTGAFVLHDDIWEFSPSSDQWTWVGGSTTSGATPVYGTQGVAATTNTPGARDAATTWTDANGNVLMFGGFAGSLNNDLWEYLLSSKEWVWIGGPNTVNGKGIYGAQGVAAGANVPGARSAAVSWTDAQGNYWLFGGYGYDSAGVEGLLNDLWEYSPSTGEWTWVGGSNTANPTGVYGTQGVAAATNVPAARDSAASWTDASGNVWMFGGEVYDGPTHSYHRINDLWKYSQSSGQWTWVAGSSSFDATGVYGVQGLAAATNVPGARAAVSTWKDVNGNLWLFGGYQYDDPTNTRFEMNDLWIYPTQ